MAINNEQLRELSRPFNLDEHYVRFGHGNKGYVTWLTYLTRPAITRRIHDVLGATISDRIVDKWYDSNATAYDQKYSVVVEISHDGDTHQAIGTDSDYMSAETRAYKRALTHLEIGLYLYESPTIQTRNTGFYDVDTKRVTSWTNEYKQAEQDALRQLGQWLESLGVSVNPNGSQPTEAKAQLWERLKTDPDILQLYAHENHLKNAIKLYEGDVVESGFEPVKQWLVNRKQSA